MLKNINLTKNVAISMLFLLMFQIILPFTSFSATVDISQDLNITVSEISLVTPTNNSIYDTGSPAGTYMPGMDFSANDNVSKGELSNYSIGISLSSKSNQKYNLDKMYIELVNIQTGTQTTPFYYINTDPNAQNITDDGNNTLVTTTQGPTISSITFGPNDGINSASTIETGISLTAPNYILWKTKAMPQVRVVCEKDGYVKKSDIINLSPIRMSSKANLINALSPSTSVWSKYNYITKDGIPGFNLNFNIRSNKSSMPDMLGLLDAPNFETLTYNIDLGASVAGSPYNIETDNITITNSNNGLGVLSYSVTNNILTIVMAPTESGNSYTNIGVSVFLPYDREDQSEVTVSLSANFNSSNGVVYSNFYNEYIYILSQTGDFNKSNTVSFVDPPVPPEDIKISETILGGLGYNSHLYNNIVIENNDFIETMNSRFIILLDSDVANLSNSPSVSLYYDNKNNVLADTDYITSYASVSFTSDPNLISEGILNGTIPTGTYDEISSGGNKVNAMMITLTKDILPDPNLKSYNISIFNNDLVKITGDEFYDLYIDDPSHDFTGHAYTYTSFNTNFSSLDEANEKYDSLLSNVDYFTDIYDAQVYLNLGTTTPPISELVDRFNATSTVRREVPIPIDNQSFTYGIYNNDSRVTSVSDYSNIYNLKLSRSSGDYSGTGALFKEGTIIEFAIDTDDSKYLNIADIPYINKYDQNTMTYTKISIPVYSQEPGSIKLTIPTDFSMFANDNIIVPVEFIVPSSNTILDMSLDISNPLYLDKWYGVTNGFPNNTVYYTTVFENFQTTLVGAQIDTTGLSVTPAIYPNGMPVTYIARICNMSPSSSSYYAGMAVPNNIYNPSDGSDNNLNSYIRNIVPFDSSYIIYYQTESNVTPDDIALLKNLNEEPFLNTYYHSTIVSEWTLYNASETLPDDVVMLFAYVPNLPQGNMIRIDYDVYIDIPTSDINIYNNSNAIVYYSTNSTLETSSNSVMVQNLPSTGTVIARYVELGTGEELADPELLIGPLNFPYSTTDKIIPGYTLIGVPFNSTGTYQETLQEVVYYYSPNSRANGTVIVKYLEQGSNRVLASETTLSGSIGSSYNTSSKSIIGYTLVGTPYNSSGTYQETVQEVIYYYNIAIDPDPGDPLFIILFIIIIILILISLIIILPKCETCECCGCNRNKCKCHKK